MKLGETYPWPGDATSAIRLQAELSRRVSDRSAVPATPRWVAGIDVSPPDQDGWTRDAVVVLDWATMEVATGSDRPPIPYIPGLLAFREVPAIAEALERLETAPDAILVDGQGVAHPRRFGIACHIGLMTGIPTIGCAKSVLRGKYAPLGPEKGSSEPLVDRGEIVGAALRTRANVPPVYVSIGHNIDLRSALDLVLGCARRHRLPEPTRKAHLAAGGTLLEAARASGVQDER